MLYKVQNLELGETFNDYYKIMRGFRLAYTPKICH